MSPRESNPDELNRTVQGPTAVEQACEAAREFGTAQWLGKDELARLCIIVEELVANLYEHGGLTEEDGVELTFACEPRGIRVTIVDPGTPFDPWAAARKVEQPERGGGVGIDINRAWAQAVDYRSTPEGNRLELLLPVSWEG
jgi:anti-sigma regulatory factor (Ser/Thr protein kinase)